MPGIIFFKSLVKITLIKKKQGNMKTYAIPDSLMKGSIPINIDKGKYLIKFFWLFNFSVKYKITVATKNIDVNIKSSDVNMLNGNGTNPIKSK